MQWTSDQQSRALQEGWGLFIVIDLLADGRHGNAQLRILDTTTGVPSGKPQYVTQRAKSGSGLHLHALRSVAASAVASTKTRKT